MSRLKKIQHIRTTRANLETNKTNSNLLAGEVYLITDENRLAVGLSANTYSDFAIKSESDLKLDKSVISENHLVTGFVNRTDSTLSFATKIFTITGTSYVVYSDGVKSTKAGATTIDFTGKAKGFWYIYFDSSFVIQSSQTAWAILSNNIPIATVYWDGTTNGVVQDERHLASRNATWHLWAHDTIGTRYESGFAGTFTGSAISVTAGTIHDEDIDFTTSGTKTTCCLWYADGAGKWKFSAGYSYPFAGSSATQMQYDDGDGTLANIDNTKYCVSWLYATTDVNYPIYLVAGTGNYSNLSDAQAATIPTTIPTAEGKLIYKVIYRQGAGSVTFISSTDYRTSATLPSGGSTNPPASNVTFIPTGNIASTDVQNALAELDTEKQDALGYTPVTNARTLTINGTGYDLSADRSWTVSASASRWNTISVSWASTSTFSVTDNTTNQGIFRAGVPLKYKVNSVNTYAYGIVTNYTTGTVTIAGAPLTASIQEMNYGSPEMVVQMPISINGLYDIGSNSYTLLQTLLLTRISWKQSNAYLVKFTASHEVPASGTGTNPSINICKGSASGEVCNQSVGLTLSTAGTEVKTDINIDSSKYKFVYGNRIEIELQTTGNTTNTARDLTATLIFVLE